MFNLTFNYHFFFKYGQCKSKSMISMNGAKVVQIVQ